MKNISCAILCISLFAGCSESPKENEAPVMDGYEKLRLRNIQKAKEKQLVEERRKKEEGTGIWQVKYYVDEFEERTDQSYIIAKVSGDFSNSATEGSKLGVRFLIDHQLSLSIFLYEYGGNNPVKRTGSINSKYDVLVQSSKGTRKKIRASNSSNRISIVGSNASTIVDFLKEGGEVKFLIVNVDRESTKYRFSVKDNHPRGLVNAIKARQRRYMQ